MNLVVFEPILDPVSYIVGAYLIEKSLGVDPADVVNDVQDTDWVLYTVNLPQDPEQVICVADTTPEVGLRNQIALDTCLRYGLQIRTRAACHEVAWKRSHEIKKELDQVHNLRFVYTAPDTTDQQPYRFHGIQTESGPIPLGKELETGQGKRYLVSHNVLVSITRDTP